MMSIHQPDNHHLLRDGYGRRALTSLAAQLGTAPLLKGREWSIEGPDGRITLDAGVDKYGRVKFRRSSTLKDSQHFARDMRKLDGMADVEMLKDREYIIYDATPQVVSALKSALGYNSVMREAMTIAASRELGQKPKKRRCKYRDISKLQEPKNEVLQTVAS